MVLYYVLLVTFCYVVLVNIPSFNVFHCRVFKEKNIFELIKLCRMIENRGHLSEKISDQAWLKTTLTFIAKIPSYMY